MHVLVIDDFLEVRELFRERFKAEGHSVYEASNGAEGLSALRQFKFDLVISDLMMPIMDGAQFLKIAHAIYPFLPIAIVSGGSHFSHDYIVSLGAIGVWEKVDANLADVQLQAEKWLKNTIAARETGLA